MRGRPSHAVQPPVRGLAWSNPSEAFSFYGMVGIISNMNVDVIATEFGLTGPVTVEPAPSGLIHKTFFVNAADGEFVLQQLHEIVRPETCEDAAVITKYARERAVPVPEFLLTRDGRPWYRAEHGSLWRAMKRLPGESRDAVRSPDEAHSAAALLGQFHAVVKTCAYECRGAIPHFHDTPYIFEQFKKVVAVHEGSELLARVRDDAAFVLQEVPKQLLPSTLPRQIVHGDLKISNFLFEGPAATALLDFDTCMNHTPLVDIGDALRSWCNAAGEDGEAAFDRAIYDAAVEGYCSRAALSEEERALIPQAFRLLTIELAMRFLKDYFDDVYFGWNAEKFSSRREHNLARTRGQLGLYRAII